MTSQTERNRRRLNSILKKAAPTLPMNKSVEGLRHKAFVKNFATQELMKAYTQLGQRGLTNRITAMSVMENAARRFAAMKKGQA